MTVHIDADTLAALLSAPAPTEPEAFPDGHCEYCGCPYGVFLEDSRTAYEYPDRTRYQIIADIQLPDPNAPLALCRDCAEEHHEFWDDMWTEYYSGRL